MTKSWLKQTFDEASREIKSRPEHLQRLKVNYETNRSTESSNTEIKEEKTSRDKDNTA